MMTYSNAVNNGIIASLRDIFSVADHFLKFTITAPFCPDIYNYNRPTIN